MPIAALLLIAAAAGGELAPPLPVRVSQARAAYRSCIADRLAGQPRAADVEAATATALTLCRDAEAALRTEYRKAAHASAADTLALVLDTRIDGQEEGLRRRRGQ